MKIKIFIINKLLFGFAIVILLFSTITAQEEYLYENISVSEGLSSSQFNIKSTICQDQFGLMWFGTVDGLNRYDGYSFKVYKNIPGDSTSLPSSNIQTIMEDADKNLWVGTNGFMSILDRKTDTFINYPIERAGTASRQIDILTSMIDVKNNFWIGTTGSSVQKWNKVDKKFQAIPFMLNIEGVDTLVKAKNAVIIAITQLRNGNILSASFNRGIYFYNESENIFEEYNISGYDQPIGIVNIFEDRGGNIWFAGRNTLSVFNPVTHSYKIIDDWKKYHFSDQDVFLFALSHTEDGNIILNASAIGILQYNTSTGKLTLQEVSKELWNRGVGKFPASKYIDKFGVTWIGLFDSGILKYDPKRKPFKFYPFEKDKTDQSSIALTTSITSNFKNKNELFISSNRKGIFRFNLEKHKMSNLNIPIPSLYTDNSNMREILFDEKDRIWFFSSNIDLSSFNIKSGKTETYTLETKQRVVNGTAKLNGLEFLPKNKILISSNGGGQIFNTETKKSSQIPLLANRLYGDALLNRLRDLVKDGKSISSFTKAGEAIELSETVSITEEKNVLVICMGEGQMQGGMFDYGTILDEQENIIWSMNKIEKTFHAGGGYKNRLQIETLKLKPGNYKFNFNTDIGHSYANFNVSPPIDSSWYGLQVFELEEKEFLEISTSIENEKKNKAYLPIFGTDIITTSRKYPNTLWIGAGSQGLFKYDISSGRFKQYINEDLNNSLSTYDLIFEDRKGILWIVYTPSGFYRFDTEKEVFISNASIPELPLTAINSIVEDFNGNMWISSSGGITKLIGSSEEDNWSTTHFDSKDGVPGGFGKGAFVTQNGEILSGTFNGVTAYYPSSENITPPIPIIFNASISDISIFDKESELKMEESIFNTKELNLTYDQNDISFEFASIHYSRPSKNRISYMLEGFNENWIYTDRNFASFTNLEPGEYTFKVRAISGYGITSEKDRSIKIFVSPPIYRTTLAYVFYGLAFVGIIFGIDRFQRIRLLTKAKEKMKIQDAEHRAEAAELQSRVVQAESDRKTKELEEARELQLSMLPKDLPQLPHLDIAVYMKTATEVGGDYYDFHIGMDGTLTVVVGDATGHGMKAGTMVTTTKSLFNVLAPNPNIVETFHEMTRCLKLMQMNKLSMCMTMLKIMGNKIQMSAAGMPPVFIYKKESQSIEEHVIKGMPLGTFNDFPYSLVESTISSGDTILMMSDGFPELFNDKKEMYGYKRTRNLFEDLAEEAPEEIISKLKNAGSEWVKDEDPNDDVTFVVIKVK